MIIPIPRHDESDTSSSDPDYEWITWYLNCPPWQCDKCQAVMFGRMKYCLFCKIKFNRESLRPGG